MTTPGPSGSSSAPLPPDFTVRTVSVANPIKTTVVFAGVTYEIEFVPPKGSGQIGYLYKADHIQKIQNLAMELIKRQVAHTPINPQDKFLPTSTLKAEFTEEPPTGGAPIPGASIKVYVKQSPSTAPFTDVTPTGNTKETKQLRRKVRAIYEKIVDTGPSGSPTPSQHLASTPHRRRAHPSPTPRPPSGTSTSSTSGTSTPESETPPSPP